MFTESKIVCNTLIHYKLSVFYRIIHSFNCSRIVLQYIQFTFNIHCAFFSFPVQFLISKDNLFDKIQLLYYK